MRVVGGWLPRCRPGDSRGGSRCRPVRDGLFAAGSASGLEGRIDGGPRRSRVRRRGRRHPGRDPRPQRRRCGPAGAFRQRRDLRSYPHRAVSCAPPHGCTRTSRPRLEALASPTLGTKRALVHGDVSPKNILHGPEGPVFLDAECAWYGDPAFDLAFCLNHLLLKGARAGADRTGYGIAFAALVERYRAGVTLGRPPIALRSARPRCFRLCSWPGWTASRRSNISPATPKRTRCAATPERVIEHPARRLGRHRRILDQATHDGARDQQASMRAGSGIRAGARRWKPR